MATKIKPGDIVEYQGKRVRVMSVDPTLPYLKCQFSHFGHLTVNSLDDLKLIESCPDTILKAGDKVIINNIPDEEKYTYGPSWSKEMDSLTNSREVLTITSVYYNDYYGWAGRIGRFIFQLYHIEPTNNFDII